MKVLVTGGNGFIGSRVVRQLCSAGHQVRCLLRETSDTSRIDDLDVERFIGDVRDPDSLIQGMEGVDGCIHLASVSSWEDMRSDALEETVIDGTRHILDCAKKAGNVRTVYISSAAAINASHQPEVFNEETSFNLGHSPLRYAIAKNKAEDVVQEYVKEGLEVIIVNPAEVYGPNDTGFITAGNIRDILKDWPALCCTGGTAVTHVDDVASGIASALENGRAGERYILGGDNLTIEELVRLTLDLGGQKKPVLILPNGLLRWTIQTMSKCGLPTPINPDVLDYATRFFFVDSSKAKQELNYQPRPARQVLESVVNWLQEAGHV